ncbi:MAG: type II toxin-antitoxin system RelE/ParE family toxin [Bacteroidota bacterium]
MEVIVTKTFSKQFKKCPPHIQVMAKNVISSLDQAQSLKDLNNIKKLTGINDFYRIRISNYRIGFKQESPNVILICIMERSQIYKAFP